MSDEHEDSYYCRGCKTHFDESEMDSHEEERHRGRTTETVYTCPNACGASVDYYPHPANDPNHPRHHEFAEE